MKKRWNHKVNNPAASNGAWSLKRPKGNASIRRYGIDPRGIRQLSVQARSLGSLPARITAVLITLILCLILGISLNAILAPSSGGTDCVADIYQEGELLASFPLDGFDAPYRFTVTGENGCVNELEIRSGSIGMVSADCPDKLCVHQGFIDRPGLPIVCLPNRLVIQLRRADPEEIDAIAR